MVDSDLIEANPLALTAIRMLAQSGVLIEQMQRMREQILSGDGDESTSTLLPKIKEFRRTTGMLQTLQELGESYSEETTDG